MLAMLEGLGQYRKRLLFTLIAVMLPLALISTVRGVTQLTSDPDPCDLTPYWISARLARDGANPYRVYQEDFERVRGYVPDSPDFVTRCNVTLEERPPLTTPTHILLMLPFSLLGLRGAAIAWALVQALSAVLIPLVMFQLNPRLPGWGVQALGVLLFLAWSPTRMAIGHGQITMLVILLASASILLAWWRRPGWAGLLLGLALTKFTLAGGLLIALFVYRHYRAAIVALLTQIAGFLLLAIIVGESPIATVQAYTSLVSTNAEVQAGIASGVISADRWLQPLGFNATLASLVAITIGAILTLALILPRYLDDLLATRRAPGPRSPQDMHRANLLVAALIPVTLLFTYHRVYDLPFLFVLVALLAGVRLPDDAGEGQARRYLIWLAAVVLISAALLVPPSLIAWLVATEELLMTGVLVLALAVSIWLVYEGEGITAEPERTEPAQEMAAR